MNKEIEELVANIREDLEHIGYIAMYTVKLRIYHGATIGYNHFCEDSYDEIHEVYEPYSDEYIKKFLDICEDNSERDFEERLCYIKHKLSKHPTDTFVHEQNQLKEKYDLQRFNNIKDTIAKNISEYQSKRQQEFDYLFEKYRESITRRYDNPKDIISCYHDYIETLYDELVDYFLADKIDVLNKWLHDNIEELDEFWEMLTDLYYYEKDTIIHLGYKSTDDRINGEIDYVKGLSKDIYKEHLNDLVDTESIWDVDLGYDVDKLKELFVGAYGNKNLAEKEYSEAFEATYSNKDRQAFIRILNDAMLNYGMSHQDFVELCGIVYKSNTYIETNIVRMIDEKNNIAEVKKEKYVQPSYRKTISPADPIRDLEDIKRIKEFLLTNGKEKWRKRNYTIFCLGISTGLRASDLLTLRIRDVFQNDEIVDEITIHEKKTGELTHSVLNSEIKDILLDYLQGMEQVIEDDFLFPSQSIYGSMKVTNLYDIFQNVQKKLNLPFHFSTHSLRKTFAYWTIRMHYYDQNIIFSLQDMLNHRDIKNTLYYSGHTKDHLKTLYDDMGKVLNGTVENAPAVSTQEQKINQILDMLTKQIGEHTTSDEK